ncbi:MAG: hypothetical protein JWM86_1662 [Thermoleophilia bacterium]|nr:hypothetical protein [Thermoleophilia bacterium]
MSGMNPTMTDTAASMPTVETTPVGDSNDPGKPTPPRRNRGRALMIGLLVAAIGFAGGIAGTFAADELRDEPNGSSQATVSPTGAIQPSNDEEAETKPASDQDDNDSLTPRAIYRNVSPAVVHIDARSTKVSAGFLGIPQEQESTGTGSGFVIDTKGHIVTNAHVIEDAQDLSVSFGQDGAKVKAKLVGEDRSSDIAVIKIDPDADVLEGTELTVAKFGDSTKLQVGDPVIAIGNPFSLDRTLTTGVVSALQREIPSLNDFQISDVIQTDAAVNPGNSGGPLLDARGRVIGVNSQIQTKSGGFDGIAFAVPSERVQSVVEQLIKDGKVEYAWLGLAGGQITPELVKQYDLDVDQGVLVGQVTPGSPADKAGIKGGREVRDLSSGESRTEGGDIITSFDGTKLTSMHELAALVDSHKPGDEVEVEYLHDGKEKSTKIKLGSRENAAANARSDDDE